MRIFTITWSAWINHIPSHDNSSVLRKYQAFHKFIITFFVSFSLKCLKWKKKDTNCSFFIIYKKNFHIPEQWHLKNMWGNSQAWCTFYKVQFQFQHMSGTLGYHKTRELRKIDPNFLELNMSPQNHLPLPTRMTYKCAEKINLELKDILFLHQGQNYTHLRTWNNPYLWDEVSMPVPITKPPTVKSSNSGKIGIVQPMWFKVLLSWPIDTKGSHFTVL